MSKCGLVFLSEDECNAHMLLRFMFDDECENAKPFRDHRARIERVDVEIVNHYERRPTFRYVYEFSFVDRAI